MPRRTLLSADQRARLFAVPVAEAELARHYVLSPADLSLIRLRRRASNRLGFAVQLCMSRYPGRTLGPSETPPPAMLAFVSDQVDVHAELFADYAQRAETRREHALELQQHLGFRTFRLDDWRACLKVGVDAAWATDRGEPIVSAMLGHLRATNVLLPASEVLERIGLAARARARRTVRSISSRVC
jgi:TnpA family transposase